MPERHGPGGGIVVIAMTNVEDFSERFSAIAVLLEILRQGYRARRGLAKVGAEIVNAERRRTRAGEQRVA